MVRITYTFWPTRSGLQKPAVACSNPARGKYMCDELHGLAFLHKSWMFYYNITSMTYLQMKEHVAYCTNVFKYLWDSTQLKKVSGTL